MAHRYSPTRGGGIGLHACGGLHINANLFKIDPSQRISYVSLVGRVHRKVHLRLEDSQVEQEAVPIRPFWSVTHLSPR